MVRLNINDKERGFLIYELSERIRDLAYMNARKRAEEVLDNLLKAWKDKDVAFHLFNLGDEAVTYMCNFFSFLLSPQRITFEPSLLTET
jgi:hypothetical protein